MPVLVQLQKGLLLFQLHPKSLFCPSSSSRLLVCSSATTTTPGIFDTDIKRSFFLRKHFPDVCRAARHLGRLQRPRRPDEHRHGASRSDRGHDGTQGGKRPQNVQTGQLIFSETREGKLHETTRERNGRGKKFL